ncbi:unnamed protein product [Closterium sp. NIES-65]|nr:unnamed protein product [Closterium sp. NIES-65]
MADDSSTVVVNWDGATTPATAGGTTSDSLVHCTGPRPTRRVWSPSCPLFHERDSLRVNQPASVELQTQPPLIMRELTVEEALVHPHPLIAPFLTCVGGPQGGPAPMGMHAGIPRSGGGAGEELRDLNKPAGAVDADDDAAAAVQDASGEVQIQRMLAGLSHLARFLRLQQAQQQEAAAEAEAETGAEEEAEAEAEAKAAAEAEAEAEAEGGETVLSDRVMARLQMGRGSEDERQQLMAVLLALKQEDEKQLPQQKQEQKKQQQKQSLCKRQKGHEQPGVPQALQVQETQEQQEQQRQEQQHWEEGGKEEVWLSAFSAFPEAGTSAKQVETTLASTFAPRYGPDGALHVASRLEHMGGRHMERSRSRGGSDPEFALRGSSTNPSSVMSNGIHNSNVMVGARGTNSSLFSSTATNSASDAGRKRKSPERPTGCATAAAHTQQHARQASHACYSRSVLGPGSASFFQANPEGPPAVAASIMHPAMVVNVNPHILPHVRTQQNGDLEGMCTKEHVDVTLVSTQLSPQDEHMVRHESETNGLNCDVHDECRTDDALDDPKGHERSNMPDECGTGDEWLPRCQGVRIGSAPNKRIKSRSMAERRRRERISEKLQRLRAKVRGRGDTCAMLGRAVGYVDALERRVMELERVIMTAAASGRSFFASNAFSGVGFARNAFANDAATPSGIPAALVSVPTGLGSDGVAAWPWE